MAWRDLGKIPKMSQYSVSLPPIITKETSSASPGTPPLVPLAIPRLASVPFFFFFLPFYWSSFSKTKVIRITINLSAVLVSPLPEFAKDSVSLSSHWLPSRKFPGLPHWSLCSYQRKWEEVEEVNKRHVGWPLEGARKDCNEGKGAS